MKEGGGWRPGLLQGFQAPHPPHGSQPRAAQPSPPLESGRAGWRPTWPPSHPPGPSLREAGWHGTQTSGSPVEMLHGSLLPARPPSLARGVPGLGLGPPAPDQPSGGRALAGVAGHCH